MRLALEHVRFIAEKISRELVNSNLVSFTQGTDPIIKIASDLITEEIKLEKAVDAEVNELMENQDEEISFYQADRKQLFWMIKRKVADEKGLILDRDDRFSNLAHKILNAIYEEDLVNYRVSENRIKNIISKAILDYGRRQDEIEDRVHEKLRSYKRTIRRGTDEYEILYEKFYEEEIAKLGV